MPRKTPELIEPQFRDPPPRGSQSGGRWLETLTPLLKHKGRWAMVKEFDSPEAAHDAQSNLTSGRIKIPQPDHDWSFSARQCELFAIYRGPRRGKK